MAKESDVVIVKVENLELDQLNPRLPEDIDKSPANMLNYIAKTTAIEDLMSAIAENGFFPGEPLIVIPKPNSTDKYIVIEGNRRLTALKLLLNPYECEKPSTRMLEISNNIAKPTIEVPVISRDSRQEILPYLGFRHITGVKQWEPLSKARYIKQLFDFTTGSDPMYRYSEVAKGIGSRRDHIKRNLDALAVYDVIKENDFYGIAKLDEESIKFSILSTALADERLGLFVGTSIEKGEEIIPSHPILNKSSLKDESIKELTKWLYEKGEDRKTRVGESRNLRELAAVVANQKALTQFRNGAALKVAYQLTEDVTKDFMELLYQSESLLIEATGMVATIDYNREAHEIARRINKHIKMIGNEIAEKNKREDDDF
ncbi:ParB/RepB/Spo0J family partition protein [Cronobacter sakazakii]|uniref:ParB/RepB/Spo0J family partition protein n=1 Tax=Cronobacter sakazakii TaxID=28141 RepID=UPI00097655AE|nr:ParB/RepB/Spo0J family partition protein [Cronobacter sakazakii]EKY2077280.1 ParB/RepB/Spo0J family partition protein [Cronobacter sakazakii]